MLQKKNGAIKREVHFYSGHDTTIAGLLVILGLFDSIQSGYGAAVILELRLKNSEYIVTVSIGEQGQVVYQIIKVDYMTFI